MTERREHRIKRLKMRSMRRGIKEMDLILQRYAENHIEAMDDASLSLYDAMLNENDHDLYQWVSGQLPAPEPYVGLIENIIADLPQTRA